MSVLVEVVLLVIGLAIGVALGFLLAARKSSKAATEQDQRVSDQRAAIVRLETQLSERAEAEKKVGEVVKLASVEAVREAREELREDAEAQRLALAEAVKPVTETIEVFRETLTKQKEAIDKDYSSVTTNVERLSSVTLGLKTALSSPVGAGAWGRTTLENVLAQAGMVRGTDYDMEVAVDDQDSLLRPDFTIKMPDDRKMPIDSKAPLKAYQEAQAETDPELRKNHMKQHAVAMRKHIDDLVRRNYPSKMDSYTDFTVMFVPGEHIITDAISADPDIVGYALDKRIVLASPMVMILTLQSINQLFNEVERVNNAELLVKEAEDLVDRVITLHGLLVKASNSVKSAAGHLDAAAGSWNSRVRPRANSLRKLSRSIPEVPQMRMIDAQIRDYDVIEAGATRYETLDIAQIEAPEDE